MRQKRLARFMTGIVVNFEGSATDELTPLMNCNNGLWGYFVSGRIFISPVAHFQEPF